ncbi:hypothetical protein FN846DRAFT_918735 [Sphaerosporella brunnea]|uniref:Uncharacterized protein n=1 Tax=Sphaerosporella brunnea TaxID=1250544 RepID=A0A5J5EYT0_9PEZI|nr:hypothetical protein FN846DRAFT_918735 [Sphaerosporella brunnea]
MHGESYLPLRPHLHLISSNPNSNTSCNNCNILFRAHRPVHLITLANPHRIVVLSGRTGQWLLTHKGTSPDSFAAFCTIVEGKLAKHLAEGKYKGEHPEEEKKKEEEEEQPELGKEEVEALKKAVSELTLELAELSKVVLKLMEALEKRSGGEAQALSRELQGLGMELDRVADRLDYAAADRLRLQERVVALERSAPCAFTPDCWSEVGQSEA